MKVLSCTVPGSLEYLNRKPPRLAEGQAILRINRVGICGTDLHAYEGTQPYFNYPRVLGHELAGEVVEIADASAFDHGESVTIVPYFYCGRCIACRTGKPNCCTSIAVSGVHIDGGMAEFLSVPTYALVHGEGLSHDTLAMVEPLAIGAHAVRRAMVKKGEFVLVVGAGPIGLAVINYARLAGGKLIVLDVQDNRLRFCHDHVSSSITINASKTDVYDRINEITSGDMIDVVMDATGNQAAINSSFKFMAHGGRYVLVGLQKGDIIFSHPEFHKREASLMSSRNATRDDFAHVISSIKNREIDPSSWITHRASFEKVRDCFERWIDPKSAVIKAMVSFG